MLRDIVSFISDKVSGIVCKKQPAFKILSITENWLQQLYTRDPTLWKFIDWLKKEQSLNEVMIEQYIYCYVSG